MITNDSPPIYQASYTFDLEEELTDDDIRNLCSLLQDVSSKWNNISMKENEYFP
jgi:hypothetical protein